MAQTATLHHFAIQLADMDRGIYESFELRVARQPSETAEFMLTRVLAYCLEYQDGIVLTEGIAAVDEPAVMVKDLTGRVTAWIEVGAPDPERLHRGAKLAGRAAVYTHRDPGQLLAQYAGQRIHRAADIPVYSFERNLIGGIAGKLERRNSLSVTVTERQLYLDLGGENHTLAITEQRAG
ncbi:YaeQ family protein [Solimonas sp. SE-A11]|uniref:YaeQ family protein n=1 Tax=Solimonas sp. SE-A11 TaxID=3054954 RepID=UPI00259CA788|nr:YaeQ family protein [Solimonas sp. SE-A11]MDM4771279.1 YaeQ family protein [Solimonas sp. SE-A11]